MLKVLDEFRQKLDDIMHRCMDKRIVLYGYGYSGKFIGWYGEYYHSIKPDYIITQDQSSNIPYEFELYRESLFDFGYKDVKDAVVWLSVPETEEIRDRLEAHGYVKNETYYDFCELIYADTGRKGDANNVQFLRWLEELYGCDFVTRVGVEEFESVIDGIHPYVATTPKEIFPILDKCHCLPGPEDAIFDFGCGKGAAMVTFLDYGFQKVGGVEYERGIYETLVHNFERLQLLQENNSIQCICGDASKLKQELDEYNWFYFFDPFEINVFEKVIQNIFDSVKRIPRRVHIINILPRYHQLIIDTGMFVLTNQFDIMSRQRVVDVFVTNREFEK